MSKKTFQEVLKDQKVIASLRRQDDLGEILNHKKVKTVFLLNSSILDLQMLTTKIKEHNKNVFVHIDLVEGLGKDASGIKFAAKNTGINGIITTKSGLIKAAAEEGLLTIQRFFVVDSEAVKTGIKMAKLAKPDAIEIMPAFLPKYYLDEIAKELGLPIIAGGLIRTPEDAKLVLATGVQAITTSRRMLWNLN